ncbi:MAG: DegT/DnrJ/EryC1/StrS family aminotransferase, partial [Anaerolineales bacterium]
SSFLPADILAAFLFAQLEAREEIQVKRAKIWRRYFEDLESWAADNNVRIPIIPDDCEQSYHMFYLLMPTLEQRQALIAHLKRRNIESVFHYLPLHLSKMGRSFGGKQGDCPVTEDVSDRLVRLPLHHSLTEADLDRVVSAVTEFELCSSV